MKKILIIGVRSALGNAIKKRLSGFKVVGTSRHPPFSQVVLELDLAKSASLNLFLDEIATEKPLDGIVFVAANKLVMERFEKIPLDAFQADMTINLLNPIHLLQRLLPLLSPDAPIILTLTEMVINEPPPYFSSYVVSKYALLGLLKALNAEFSTVRVNAVSPGMMDTPFIAHLPSFLRMRYAQKSGKLVSVDAVSKKVLEIIEDKTIRGENVVVRP